MSPRTRATRPPPALWAGLRGDPHGDRLDPGLGRIGVEEVGAAVDRLLAAP